MIPESLFPLIGISVVLLIIVIILVVIFVQLSRRSRNPSTKAPKQGNVKPRPAMQDLLRLRRDPDTGRVITEFQGQAVRDPRTLSQSERDYLVRLAKDWSAWLGIPEAQPAAPVAASPAAPASPTPTASPAAPAAAAVEPAPAAPEAAVAAPAIAAAAASVPTAVVTPLPEPPSPRSIVQQVDDILQEKLAAHPAPVPTIHLVEDSHKGVTVWVNSAKFEGIDSVTDPDVRMLIRSAVVEWEHRAEK